MNPIIKAAKKQWIPVKDLLPGDGQKVCILTENGRAGDIYFQHTDIVQGCWSYIDSPVLYWWPVVDDMPGVTPGKWYKGNGGTNHD